MTDLHDELDLWFVMKPVRGFGRRATLAEAQMVQFTLAGQFQASTDPVLSLLPREKCKLKHRCAPPAILCPQAAPMREFGMVIG